MKRKDIQKAIAEAKANNKKVREKVVVFENILSFIFDISDRERCDYYDAVLLYICYGIVPNFAALSPTKAQQFRLLFSLLKKQRIGWENACKSDTPENLPPDPTLDPTPDQVYKDKKIRSIEDKNVEEYKEDIEKENGKSEISLSGNPTSKETEIDFQKLIDFFNETTQGVFGTIRPPLGKTRKSMVKARMTEHGKDAFNEVVKMAMESDFLKGKNDKGWRASFDWLIKPLNFEKVLSGNYANREKPTDRYKGDDTIGKVFERRGID